MASKKHFLTALLIVLVHSVGFAQLDWGWDWKDSSKVAVKRLPQRNEFLNNQYPYPPMPRNLWEVAVSVGNARIMGDVDNYGFGYGAGITVRKALNNMISLRGGLLYQKTNGIDAILSTNALRDGSFSATQPFKAVSTYGAYVYYQPSDPNPAHKAWAVNYRNASYTVSIEPVFSLNSLSHYRGNPKWDVYVFGGYALMVADVDTRLVTDSAGLIPFNAMTVDYSGSKATVQSDVNAAMNAAGARYTNAPVRARRSDLGKGNFLITHSMTYGAGFSYKVNNQVSIGLEDRVINTFNGDMDALNTGNSDIFNYLNFHINVTVGKKGKRVQPLWWINPNNYVYNELNTPKHMKMPKVILPDADKDGVTDQFDLEPNTPAGAPVDSHGRAKDTDGDGVPDYRDKELLTPHQCFPVDNDGVGTCPEPACCKEMKDFVANMKPIEKEVPACTLGNISSIHFKGNAKLSKDAEAYLSEAAVKIKANPSCKVKVLGYGAATKAAQQLSWERVNVIVKYLIEKLGISESRLLFVYAQDGDADTVDLQGTTEDGPNTVPAPHPNLKPKN